MLPLLFELLGLPLTWSTNMLLAAAGFYPHAPLPPHHMRSAERDDASGSHSHSARLGSVVTHHAAADTHHPYLLAASDVQDQVGHPPLAGPHPDAATVDAAKVTHKLAHNATTRVRASY